MNITLIQNIVHNFSANQVESLCIWDFTKLSVLGEGRYGRVFKARNKKTGQNHAIKVLSKEKIIKENTMRYLRVEKYILENLENNFILKLDYFFQSEKHLFFVTDCLEGDLHSIFIEARQRINYDYLKLIIICISHALQNIHDNCFIYRDLKAENVLLDKNGFPILCDFGLSYTNTHRTTTLCGTSEYFAPEMIVSNSYDERIDWWALGILIYELIYLESPFKDKNTYSLYEKIINQDLEFPESVDCPDHAQDLIKKLLHKNPKQRLFGFNNIIKEKFLRNVDSESVILMKVKPNYTPTNHIKTESPKAECSFNEEDFESEKFDSSGNSSDVSDSL